MIQTQPIFSVYGTSSTFPLLQWSFDAQGNLVSDDPTLGPASLRGNAHCAVERVERGPYQSLRLSNDGITLPLSPLLEVAEEDFSVCAWIRTGDSGISKIIDKRIEDSGTIQGWSFFIYQSRINLQLADGKLIAGNTWFNYAYSREHLAPLPIVSDNQWHHLAVTINRDELDGGRWYVDGVEVGQRFNPTNKQGSLSTHIPLTIGQRSDSSGGGFRGNIGDIRLYKRAIPAEEVRAIYQSVQLPPSNGIADPATLPQNSVIYYRGVVLPERYLCLHPHQWQPHWILEESNAEVRRLLVQEIGYSRILQELQAIEVDSWNEYTLLKLPQAMDSEPLLVLKMTCPSTGSIHTLRVPPQLASAREAIRWAIWGIDPEQFAVQT
ncbi:LamG domain-containing protein [Microcoleus sp. FACHB-672]|uniref:LamG domain-containing protein n=1 Tax=Microcoleus sp. FACHB-672 TaxID=2692825 RepID=UPI001684420C|nr:LamG domain-containing protein [Microcoleus sp. FACHB-672]MBD2043210.1 LamG domain-containing protein [Microcoleus sp. FACHB-672]